MKTLKIIAVAAMTLLGLASCSDEKKALNFVQKEVVSENNLNDYIIRYKIVEFKDGFGSEIRKYLNSISEKSTYPEVYISEEFAHYCLSWLDHKSFYRDTDHWKYHRPGQSIDSDIILNTILLLISEKIDTMLANDTIICGSELDSRSKEYMYNNILSKAVAKGHSVVDYQMTQAGLEDIDPILGKNRELRQTYTYDWNLMGPKEQSMFIDDVVFWAVGNCRNEVISKNYKLIDKQCTTLGENYYDVTYLLEPKSEIHFYVSKVGKTFVLSSIQMY